MKEIKVAENKTLKLTNVLSREIHPEEMKLTGTSYTIYVNQDEDDAVVDVFMETK